MIALSTKLLQALFCIITGKSGVNWLSKRFHRWYNANLRRENADYINQFAPERRLQLFEVTGAGYVGIEPAPFTHTARTAGLHFAVDWAYHGIKFGGVLGIVEAKRLAHFILEQCDSESRTELEIIKEQDPDYYKYLQDKLNETAPLD